MNVRPSLPPDRGRLVLPRPEERRLDGGVFLQAGGRRIPLRWEGSERLRATTDIDFGRQSRLQQGKGNILPERLDGWDRVSPLESLAGGRPSDDVWVRLDDPRWDGDTLVVKSAPVEIAGPERGLAQVVDADGTGMEVRWFDPARRRFSAPERVEAATRPERTDLSRLEGDMVWLVGTSTPQGFVARSLVPAGLHRVAPQVVVEGLDGCLDYVRRRIWSHTSERPGQVEKALLRPGPPREAFRSGPKYLVMHLFGGAGGPRGDAPLPLGLVPGHFAFGTAVVRDRDPWTGGPSFDITYRQVYGQGPDGVLSAPQDWETYMGDFQRGWLYSRPVADLVVSHPAMERTYRFAGLEFDFFAALDEEFSRMEARYRSGDGDGVAVINTANSCSQDSANAMFAVLERIRRLEESVAVYPGEPQYRDWKDLCSLARDLRRFYSPTGRVPAAWRANAERAPLPVQGWIGILAQTALTWNTVFPRHHQQSLAEILLRHGAQIHVQKTNGIAGPPDSVPLAANSPTRGR